MRISQYIISPLNYIGGKKRILSQLLPMFPQDVNIFVDLFCGGCNVGINAQARHVIFNDNITYLIDMYRTFQKQSIESVIKHIETRIDEFKLSLTNKKGYTDLRQLYNTNRDPLDLFVLIAYSFNHQIRFNTAHEYNNPFGKNRSSFNINMRTNLEMFLKAIKNRHVSFQCMEFRRFDYSILTKNDFIYADPPYLITSGTYNDGKLGFTGWGIQEELSLLSILKDLDEKGIRFALSNVTEHKGKENYILKNWISNNNFIVHHIATNYNNSNYHTANCDKGETVEVLITNY